MDWFDTVFLLIAFSATLGIALSFVYHILRSDSGNIDEGALVIQEQDLTDMRKKEALIELFLMPEDIPGNDTIAKAFVFAVPDAEDNVELGYVIDYGKNEHSTLLKRTSYIMEKIALDSDEGHDIRDIDAVHRKIEEMDDLLGKLSIRCGFAKAAPVVAFSDNFS